MKNCLSCLPKINENEGFVALLMVRRKWMLAHDPKNEAGIREKFKSDQMLVGKELLVGDERNMENRIKRLLSGLSKDYSKKLLIKGHIYDAYELWQEFPHAFSLMVTYEPRDLLRATKALLVDTTWALLFDNYSPRLINNFGQEWISKVQKTARKNPPRYLLLDCDDQKAADIVAKRLVQRPVYAVTTPSGGTHYVVEITEEIKYQVYIKDQFRPLIQEGALEIKTNDFLTHLDVGIDPLVKAISL